MTAAGKGGELGGEGKQKGIERPPKYLSAQQVADRYGLTRGWVYNCAKLRKYARYVGRYLMWTEADLEKFEGERSDTQGYPITWIMRNVLIEKEKTQAAKRKDFKLKFDLNPTKD